jgi:H+/Cl- antiporter ClcA
MHRDVPQFPHFRRRRRDDSPHSAGLAFVASLIAVLVVLMVVLPQPVVLPVFTLGALLAAACAVLLAILPLRGNPSCAGTAWDMAGAFTLVGCAAAIFGEIEPLIEIIRPPGPRSKLND